MKKKTLGKTAKADLLESNVEEVIVASSLQKKLESEKKLRVKHGVDPTSPNLHIGHAVVLWKLREFQELGHQLIFIIGDTTASIGDPSGKSKTRPRLSTAEIKKNAKTYLDQIGLIVDTKKAKVVFNSDWFGKMSLSDTVKLASNFTVARLIERDDFAKRLKKGLNLHLHELLYPVLQAQDSVEVSADVEVGGTDQLFNMLAGRDLQRKLGKPEQDIITVPLLVGTDGKEKMSKSLNNDIGLKLPPKEMFAKLMAVPDEQLKPYATLAARWNEKRIKQMEEELKGGKNPRDVKAEVAEAIVSLYVGGEKARRAREKFRKAYSEGEVGEYAAAMLVKKGQRDLLDLLSELGLKSRSEARRLIEQGGLKINEKRVDSWKKKLEIKKGDLIQVGKKKIYKVK